MKSYKTTYRQIQISIAYICVLLLSVNLFFSTINFQEIDSNIIRFAVVIILIANLFTVPTLKITGYDTIAVTMCLIYYFLGKQSVALNVLILYVIAFYLKQDSIENLKRRLLIILFLIISLWCIMFFSGLISDSISTDYGRVRHYLGFKNINQSSLFTLPFLILLFDVAKGKRIIRFLTLSLALFLFHLTNTRSAFYAMIIYVVVSFISENASITKIKRGISIAISIFIPLVTLLFLMSNKILAIFPIIDEILTLRVSIIAKELATLNPLNYIFGMHELLLDNSYVMFLTTFGIIGFMWWFGGIKKSLFLNKGFEWSYLITVLTYGFFESTIFIPESILAMLFLVILLKDRAVFKGEE